MLAALESAGAQKALSFMCLGIFGRLIKDRFTVPQMAGIQRLILDAMLPCVIFQSLCSIELDLSVAKWPLMGLAFLGFQLASTYACTLAVFPGKGLAMPRRTAFLQLATTAPGLSALVFVKEFVGAEAAGKAALFDLPGKLYLIFVLPKLLATFGEKKAAKAKKAEGSALAALASDPLNVAIVGGLLMAATGTPYKSLKFVGQAITMTSAAQSPVLFMLIGMKIKLSGATPSACLVLLSARQACAYAFHAAVCHFMGLAGPEALTLLLMLQAAVSVIAWSQMSKAGDSGIGGYSTEFAFDIVGFAMPIAMALQTTACLAPQAAVLAAVPPAAGVAAAAAGLLFANVRGKLQSPATWNDLDKSA